MRTPISRLMLGGYVMQEQPFSVNDGEGIRSTIFLAGCPMRCRWCSNPEGFALRPRTGYYRRNCIGCGKCAQVCPSGIGIDLNAAAQDGSAAARSLCTGCGKCADVCPSDARRRLVRFKSADEIVSSVTKYDMFYRSSGGGITFSGGEATFQPELLDYLTKLFYDKGYSIDLETCGLFDFGRLRPSLERMDLIFLDLKHMDDAVHREYTGCSNGRILENACRLPELDASIVIRVPLIGGVNADEENIRRTAAFVHENLPGAAMELLPYHRLGFAKYEALGMELPPEAFCRPGDDEINRLEQIVRGEGVEVVSYK